MNVFIVMLFVGIREPAESLTYTLWRSLQVLMRYHVLLTFPNYVGQRFCSRDEGIQLENLSWNISKKWFAEGRDQRRLQRCKMMELVQHAVLPASGIGLGETRQKVLPSRLSTRERDSPLLVELWRLEAMSSAQRT